MTVDPAALTGNVAGSSSQNGNGFTYFDCPVCGRSVSLVIATVGKG